MKNERKKRTGDRGDRRWRMFSTGILLLCGLLLCIGTYCEVRSRNAALAGQLAEAEDEGPPAKRVDLAWYVRSGQWRADIRSLAAAIQYLSESPVVVQTNGPVSKADNV